MGGPQVLRQPGTVRYEGVRRLGEAEVAYKSRLFLYVCIFIASAIECPMVRRLIKAVSLSIVLALSG